jgi:hypothetical protein
LGVEKFWRLAAMVAQLKAGRTLVGMKDTEATATTKQNRQQIISDLAEIGATRMEQVAKGGGLWAEYLDWCHAWERESTEDAFDSWLAEHTQPLAQDVVVRLRAYTRESTG